MLHAYAAVTDLSRFDILNAAEINFDAIHGLQGTSKTVDGRTPLNLILHLHESPRIRFK